MISTKPFPAGWTKPYQTGPDENSEFALSNRPWAHRLREDRFRALSPDVDVLIDSSLKLADLDKVEADVAIRFGAAPSSDLFVKRLFDERLCVFCGPALTRGSRALKRVQDLERATLLHRDMSEMGWATVTRRWMTWQGWLKEVGVTDIDCKRGTTFSDYNLAVQAAIAGQGVVLGSLPVLHDLMTAGLLVNPFRESVDPKIGYDLVADPGALARPAVQGFADWIVAEAALQSSQNQQATKARLRKRHAGAS